MALNVVRGMTGRQGANTELLGALLCIRGLNALPSRSVVPSDVSSQLRSQLRNKRRYA